MSDEQKTAEEKRIERMDKVAESLLLLIAKEGTSEAQQGRLFAQVMQWYKLRPTLVPVEPGERLKEMSDGVKSKGTKRSGSAGTGGRVAKDGRAIQAIIRTLPKFGGGANIPISGNGRGAGGDQASAQRAGERNNGDDLRVHPDDDGDVARDVDGDGDGLRV